MEFELKDYAEARGYADHIKTIADDIMAIFDEIDATMNKLYGTDWASSGAEGAHDRYNDIRKNYDSFYEKVVKIKEHIYSVTKTDEQADTAAGRAVTDVNN